MRLLFTPCGCLVLTGLFLCRTVAQAQQRGAGGAGASRTTTRQYPGSGAIGDAYFSIDPETRRVVIITDEDTSQHISQVLSNLDRPKPQVLIKVVFMEVLHNKSSDIGIEGGWNGGMGGGTNGPMGAFANAFGASSLGAAAGTNFNAFGQPLSLFQPMPPGAGLYQVLGQDYQVTLRAIAQSGSAKVISRPSILARNNQPATITVGQSVPLITSVRYDNFGNAINSVTYQDVGVILKVTPFITPDNLVEMIVQPQISSIDNSFTVPLGNGAAAPVIDVRSADTVVITPDGQTVIIGGLMADTKAASESKIPFLGDIPLLGNLFKRRTKTGSNTELLIFLTPHIVQAPSQLVAVSDAERAKSDAPRDFSEEQLNKFLDTIPTKESPGGSSRHRKPSN